MTERKRSPNWLPEEKNLLLDLVTEHFAIVENKKTDGFSIRQKAMEWKDISDKYNSQCPYIRRTAENLKSQWECMKKTARKQSSNIKMHSIETGDGPPKPPSNDPFFSRIMSLFSSSGTGLNNTCDNDSVVSVTDQHSFKSVSSRNKNWFSRRRQIFPASSSSTVAVHKKKAEAIDLQIEHAQQERQEAKILHDMDLQIKKEILKQEKIKTRLLLMELRFERKEP